MAQEIQAIVYVTDKRKLGSKKGPRIPRVPPGTCIRRMHWLKKTVPKAS